MSAGRFPFLMIASALIVGCGTDPEPIEPSTTPNEAAQLDFDLLSWADIPANAIWSAGLTALRASCERVLAADDTKPMLASDIRFGTVGDWRAACGAVVSADDGFAFAAFQSQFAPVALSSGERRTGRLTGYYEPLLEVRWEPTPEFSAPLRPRPADLITVDLGRFETDLAGRRIVGRLEGGRLNPYLDRAAIEAAGGEALAWGRPLEVFFLQIQGSGRLRDPDGGRYRAAFAAHNGRPYTSIGAALIRQGELQPGQASKPDIEAWIAQQKRETVEALFNRNPRYVFFDLAPDADPDRGPNGAQGLPLTAMGSLAVDPKLVPYGTPILLDTRLPAGGGDYQGAPAALLVTAQDTGGAITGPMRGDLFFGTGDEAGEQAGVMNHPAAWTGFVPVAVIAGWAGA
ncbi:MAG: murein transglycosylase A [Maricaulaceae bacterium]